MSTSLPERIDEIFVIDEADVLNQLLEMIEAQAKLIRELDSRLNWIEENNSSENYFE
jgi:hypothetical protein